MEALDQDARVGVGLGVEALVRVAVAGEEILQPEQVRIPSRRLARGRRPGLEQARGAYQRAHDRSPLFLAYQQGAQRSGGMAIASPGALAVAVISAGRPDN